MCFEKGTVDKRCHSGILDLNIHRDKEHKVGKAHSVIELGNVTFMLVKASPEH